MRFLFLQTHTTSYSFYSSVTVYTVKEKEGKSDRKLYQIPYGWRNPFRNLKSENFQDYVQKPQRNCMFEFGFRTSDQAYSESELRTYKKVISCFFLAKRFYTFFSDESCNHSFLKAQWRRFTFDENIFVLVVNFPVMGTSLCPLP